MRRLALLAYVCILAGIMFTLRGFETMYNGQRIAGIIGMVLGSLLITVTIFRIFRERKEIDKID